MNREQPLARSPLSFRAALLAGARIIGFALTLPLPLVLVRTLDQEQFGLYKQLFQVLQTALTLLGLHVSLSAYYFMPRHPEKKSQVALNVVIFYGAIGSIVATVFAVFPRWITIVFKDDGLVPYMPLIGVAILLWLVSSLLEVVTVANSDIRAATIFTVLIQLLKSGMLLAAGAMFRNIHALAWAAVLQGGLQCLILFLYLHRQFGRFWIGFDRTLFKTQLSNAIPFGLGGLAYATHSDMHNYFVLKYFSAASFGIYSVGCFELPLLNLLVDSVISVLLPEVARREAEGDRDGIIALWASAVRKLAFFFVPAYTLMFVMRYEFITALFTKAYADSVPIFAINLINIFLFISVPTSIIRAFDELKYFRLRLSLMILPFSFVALYIGVHVAGLIGAVTAMITVQTIDLGIIVTRIARRLKMTPGDLKLLLPIFRTASAAAVAAVITLIVKPAFGEAHVWPTLTACSAVFGVVHLVAAFAFGAVTDDEKSQLRVAVQKLQRFGSIMPGARSVTEVR